MSICHLQVSSQPCRLGWLLIAADQQGLRALLPGDDPQALREDLHTRFPKAELQPAGPDLEECLANICHWLEKPCGEIPASLPLAPTGTAFQQRVWQALRNIRAGQHCSYRDVAHAVGQPTASRAVARACAANPLALLIPCHRVLRSDGGISGYRWGVERKRALLAEEQQLNA